MNIEEKLEKLYYECIEELKNIGINIKNEKSYGRIDIKIGKNATKRYGCCKQENPDKKSMYIIRRKINYYKFNVHHIEISKWVMELNDNIIKNTIMHELIHCIPYCNNHGKVFKKYANLINKKLGYGITRLGNKEQDYQKSNLEYSYKRTEYKYKLVCIDCGCVYYRKRFDINKIKKYRCGICNGNLKNI